MKSLCSKPARVAYRCVNFFFVTEERDCTKLNIRGKGNFRDCIIINCRQTHSVNGIFLGRRTLDKLCMKLARMSKVDQVFHKFTIAVKVDIKLNYFNESSATVCLVLCKILRSKQRKNFFCWYFAAFTK